MQTCFVIQPFDKGRFDKRYNDVYDPAIKDAGLEPYRADQDVKAEILIDAIEEGIKNASVCLADITSDNPNVWYELGFAFASGRPVVMVCSTERTGHSFPFDIQHRNIVTYTPESASDFAMLRTSITARIKALLNKREAVRRAQEIEQVAPMHGLTPPEIVTVANLAGDTSIPGSTTSLWSLKSDCERSGLTSIGFSLAWRRLVSKNFVETSEEADHNGEPYQGARLTEAGWAWVEHNSSLFVLKNEKKKKLADDFDDEIPF